MNASHGAIYILYFFFLLCFLSCFVVWIWPTSITIAERRKDKSKLGAVGVADKTIEEDEDLDNEEEESDENNEDVLYELETMKLVNSIKKLLALKGGECKTIN